MAIEFHREGLTPSEQSVVTEGFQKHSDELGAPAYRKERIKWLLSGQENEIQAALTADILWDWAYIDELWVASELRGQGIGQQLMRMAEDFAVSERLEGIWLWTQSWQAEGFYQRLGYEEFTRFDDFPKGYTRIGFRKNLP